MLLHSARNKAENLAAFLYDQHSRALRTVKLVRGETERVCVFVRQPCVSCGLNAVRIEKNTPIAADFTYFFNGLNNSRFVISRHNRAKYRIFPQSICNTFSADGTVVFGGDERHVKPEFFHIRRAFRKRSVFDCRQNEVSLFMYGAHAFKRGVARLRSA